MRWSHSPVPPSPKHYLNDYRIPMHGVRSATGTAEWVRHMAVHAARRQWNIADYERMLEAGILGEDDRVELLCGEIVEMISIGSRHAACVKHLVFHLIEQLGSAAIVGAQDPVHLSSYSEPQPDISVCHPDPDFYAVRHPTPGDIILLIEVTDTSLLFDREEKLPLYAHAGIPEVWLVDSILG